MTRISFLGALVAVGILMIAGCKDPKAAKKPEGTKPSPTPSASTESTFVVAKPPAYEGEFNPKGLEVGNEVGQLAPEIEGKDLDGVEFKLSDYRGKVVMLDFYGDW